MNDENTLKSSGRVALLIWLKTLTVSGDATVDKKHPAILNLSNVASGCFALGRRKDNNTPVISVDASIAMFLFSYNILETVFDDVGGLYLVFGTDVPLFAVKIKMSSKRKLMLNVAELKLRNKGSCIDFYSHVTNEETKQVHFSRVLHRAHFRFTDSVYDIMPVKEDDSHDYLGLLQSHIPDDFSLTDVKNFEFMEFDEL